MIIRPKRTESTTIPRSSGGVEAAARVFRMLNPLEDLAYGPARVKKEAAKRRPTGSDWQKRLHISATFVDYPIATTALDRQPLEPRLNCGRGYGVFGPKVSCPIEESGVAKQGRSRRGSGDNPLQ